MKIKRNISFERLVNYLQMDADVLFNSLDDYPIRQIGNVPTDLWQVNFMTYSKSVKYADDIAKSMEFLQRITGFNAHDIGKKKAIIIYPIYVNYLKQVKKINDMFAEVNAEVPQKGRIVKTMEEFGMSNIVHYLANERPELHDYYYKQTVGWIYIEYRRKTHNLLNTLANQNNGKSNK